MQPRRSCPRLELPTTEHSNRTTTPMTTRGKFILTILLLGVVGFGVYRWWDKIAPSGKSERVSLNVEEVKKAIQAAKVAPVDIPLLAGTNAATLVERSSIPAVTGTSDYAKATKNGK